MMYSGFKPWIAGWKVQCLLFILFRATFGGEVRLPDAVVILHTKDGIKYDDHQVSYVRFSTVLTQKL